ncbi:universal stress protein [Chloroflexota bacterium]
MYEKILVPLDGSKLAEIALPYAKELARKLGSKITLVSVLPVGSESDDNKYHHSHRFYMQEMVKIIKQQAINVESVILTGAPAEEIVNYADREDISLIIMGTRGQSGIKRWVLGSIADKVVSATTRPVALITTDDTETSVQGKDLLSKALVILDGIAEAEAVIPYVEDLGSKLDIEVVLLQLVEQAFMYYEGADDLSYVPVSKKKMNSRRAKARRYLTKLASLLESKGIIVRVKVVTKGNSAETIIKVASQTDAGVIVMSTRGRSGISRWIFGGVRDEIVNIGNVLVLLVRPPD